MDGTREVGDGAGELFGVLASAFTAPAGAVPTLQVLVDRAVATVPCSWAAALVADRITSTPASLAATSDPVLTSVVAEIAGRAGTSPGWSAFDSGKVCAVPDLAGEERFGSYAREMLARTAVRAVLSVPLYGRSGVRGVLTMYDRRPHAFGPDERAQAAVVAALGEVALEAADVSERASNLEAALRSSREIGAAVGILVERHRLTRDEAFDVLRSASNRANRKLVDIASVLVRTGEIDEQDAPLPTEERHPGPGSGPAPDW